MKNKKIIIIGLIVLVVVGVFFFMNKRNQTQTNKDQGVTPTEALVPTVDSSVKVSLDPLNGNKEMMLKLSGIPKNTSTIEYSLSYMTKSQGLQGVIGTITLDSDATEYEKKLTLGTCSSGTCVYHEVVGSIKAELKFSGSYGDKVLNKEFSLD